MCSAAGSCAGIFDVRSARSLMRTEFREASVALWAHVDDPTVPPANAVNRISASESSRFFLIVFNNFITRYNLSAAAHGCGHTAILLIGKFDRARDCLL